MNLNQKEAKAWVEAVLPHLTPTVSAWVFPGYTLLQAVTQEKGSAPLFVGGQDMAWEIAGAFTGQVSADQLKDAGCDLVLIGHSERRILNHETDREIAKKLELALQKGLAPVLCLGENLKEHDERERDLVLTRQVGVALKGRSPDEISRLTIAYEPVWAIGTGRAASVTDTEVAVTEIRSALGKLYGSELAASVPILYGGSVKASNVATFLAAKGVQGVLVGGASLLATEYVAMLQEAQQ